MTRTRRHRRPRRRTGGCDGYPAARLGAVHRRTEPKNRRLHTPPLSRTRRAARDASRRRPRPSRRKCRKPRPTINNRSIHGRGRLGVRGRDAAPSAGAMALTPAWAGDRSRCDHDTPMPNAQIPANPAARGELGEETGSSTPQEQRRRASRDWDRPQTGRHADTRPSAAHINSFGRCARQHKWPRSNDRVPGVKQRGPSNESTHRRAPAR